MGVGIPQPLLSHLQASFKLKWMKSALKYLGTLIPLNSQSLNFPKYMAHWTAFLVWPLQYTQNEYPSQIYIPISGSANFYPFWLLQTDTIIVYGLHLDPQMSTTT